jgi:hypothetical protein
MLRVTSTYSGCRLPATRMQRELEARLARTAISTASASAEAPS